MKEEKEKVIETEKESKEVKEIAKSVVGEEKTSTYIPVKEEKNTISKKKKIILLSVIGIAILVMAGLVSTLFAITAPKDRIIKGVSVDGIDVSGLTKEEATEKLNATVEERLSKNITLKYETYETTISPEQIEAKFDIESIVNEAMQLGKGGNIFANNYQIIGTMLSKVNLTAKINYNEQLLKDILGDVASKIPGIVEESSYYIDEDELIITKGKDGLVIKEEELKNRIIAAIGTEEDIQIPVEEGKPEPIDIEKIYEEIHTEPKDAYYTTNPFEVHPHVDGVDFAISMEEAKALLEEAKDEYVIPLKITKPKVLTSDIGSGAFPDLLSSFSTKYDASNRDRSTNLQLAANKINGTVVMPGETFSYNKVVGERTIAAGYKEAKIYSNGEVIDGLGGGICQISSTLYNTVLLGNLEIVSRRNHQFLTSYVGAGRDATVVYGSTDFKFKNTRNYPIKLVASVKNGIASIKMYGVKEEKEYTVGIETKIVSSIPYTTKYIEDDSLSEGKEVVKQKGTNGTKSITYKIVKLNGVVVSRTTLSQDTYNPMQRVVVRGTKKTETKPAETSPEKPVENEQPKENLEKPTENVQQNETGTTPTDELNDLEQ